MKRISIVILCLMVLEGYSQDIHSYFEKIRTNEAELTAFIAQMPKGGDLHHHYSGSVYAETYIAYVVSQDYWIHRKTLEVLSLKPDGDRNWARFSSLEKDGLLQSYKEKLFRKWSVKDYNPSDYPSDKLFFETFGHFNIASRSVQDVGLTELKKRAQAEHVRYIETMFMGIDSRSVTLHAKEQLDERLRRMSGRHETGRLYLLMDSLFEVVMSGGGRSCAAVFNDSLQARHQRLKIDDSTFTMRYMNYVTRVMEPTDVFKAMVIAFESAHTGKLVAGVNIVAPEDHETSMQDYLLHMQMFNFCHTLYPSVEISLHAGELTTGLVKPEELTWHISEAVYTGKAMRIGHGTAVAYEHNSYGLLNYMREQGIAVEINLSSNEFILKVKDDAHPLMLYRNFGVPVVIATDDAGILRSSLTRQYVLLAQRYPALSYREIRSFVYNSIDYSFIRDPALKQLVRARLDADFRAFESTIIPASQRSEAKDHQ